MFGQLKLILIAITLLGAAGGAAYVYKLKADNAILKENQIKLEQSVASQKEVIAQQKEDFETILNANKDCESATLEVSSAGLSRIKFSIDNYDSEYFLVSTQAVN